MIIKQFAKNRVWQHILFWSVSYYFLLHFFSNNQQYTTIDYIYNALFHLTLLIGVYVNLLILIPYLLRPKKYSTYAFFLILTIIACTQLNLLFFNYLVDFIFPGYYFISYYELYDITQFFIVYIALTTLLKLSKAWFQLSESEIQLSIAQKQKLDAELKALKSQINPHFLFNSLNNIYGLALKNDKNTPAIILKLSEVMRYIIYESNEEYVLLDSEITFIKNFIALQELRSDQRAHIKFQVHGKVLNQKIAPLLFIPLLENSFKHGIKGETGPSFVNVVLHIETEHILLKIENNKGTVDEVEKKQFGGIGLQNVRQRLQLVYPGRHKLAIHSDRSVFTVQLKLML